MNECEEPGCREKATRDWQGMKLCSDHYDKYRQEHDKMKWDLGY